MRFVGKKTTKNYRFHPPVCNVKKILFRAHVHAKYEILMKNELIFGQTTW